MPRVKKTIGERSAMTSPRHLFAVARTALSTLGFAAIAFGISVSAAAAQARKPNIIVIVADDLGYNDISLNGNPLVRTPNIDAIAKDGARFTDPYTGDAVCAPSRAALLTGRYPQRYGFEYLPHLPGFINAMNGKYIKPEYDATIFPPQDPPVAPEKNGLPESEITIAQMLKGEGYTTAIFGKWHMGLAPNLAPGKRGFDEHVYYPGGAMFHAQPDDPNVVSYKLPWDGIDHWLWDQLKPQIIRGDVKGPVKGWLGDELAASAGDFMARNKDKPLFIYLAFSEAHTPLMAPKDIYDRNSYIKDEKTRIYYSMIEAMDRNVGRVLEKVKSLGLDENTIIIFASDNGGAAYTRIPMENLPYRGWKVTFFRGGVTVPYFMRWKGHIAPDQTVPGIASTLDIFPTAAAASGATLAADRKYDGRNLLPVLTGTAPNDLGNRTLYWRNQDYYLLREGHYTLQVSKYPDKVWLFDLDTDPAERINLAPFMPAKVKEMKAALGAIDKEMVPPAWSPAQRNRIDVDGYSAPTKGDQEWVSWAN
jgi:arylsulfatase A-like enzyme